MEHLIHLRIGESYIACEHTNGLFISCCKLPVFKAVNKVTAETPHPVRRIIRSETYSYDSELFPKIIPGLLDGITQVCSYQRTCIIAGRIYKAYNERLFQKPLLLKP